MSEAQRKQSCRMLKKASLLSHPTPARQDAPFRGQGRSLAVNLRFTSYLSQFLGATRERRWRSFSASCYRGNVNWESSAFSRPCFTSAPISNIRSTF